MTESLAHICPMSTVLIEIRRAKSSDARAVADAHDEAWRGAYQGVIPGVELDKLIREIHDASRASTGRIAVGTPPEPFPGPVELPRGD